MTFEWYQPKIGKPCVSIAEYGITFSKEAIRKIGDPIYIMAGYDERDNKVIIKPCDENEEHGMRLSKGKYTRLANKGFIRFLISNNIKIEGKAKRYNLQWNEDMKVFFIDLSN